jgi:hypothetical protein
MGEISKRLNRGILPAGYYALADQVAGNLGPDVLTLQRPSTRNGGFSPSSSGTPVATLDPPAATYTFRAEINEYTARQRSLIIRHVSDNRIVALIEILSPGNKASDYAFTQLLVKIGGALYQRIHVLIIDLHPPTPRDLNGIHAAVWENLQAGTFVPPSDRTLTLVSYEAGLSTTAHVEPLRVGSTLPDMPLFLAQGWHVMVPLESTYREAWEGVPDFIRGILELP